MLSPYRGFLRTLTPPAVAASFRRDISAASETYSADIPAVTSIGLSCSLTIFFIYLPPFFD
jgi:hypothetical protein